VPRAAESPYQGINELVLLGHALSKEYSAPIWMTFRQALELDAHVRKGERGSTVVYASKITRTGTDADTGDSELAPSSSIAQNGRCRRMSPDRSEERSRSCPVALPR
jgi:antirestriction protein ArdC